MRTDAASLFEYLADVNRLPDCFEGMVSVESTGQHTVHTVARVEGQRREGTPVVRTGSSLPPCQESSPPFGVRSHSVRRGLSDTGHTAGRTGGTSGNHLP